jgi:hypothetical protein
MTDVLFPKWGKNNDVNLFNKSLKNVGENIFGNEIKGGGGEIQPFHMHLYG